MVPKHYGQGLVIDVQTQWSGLVCSITNYLIQTVNPSTYTRSRQLRIHCIDGEVHQYQYLVKPINTNIWWGPSIPIFGKAQQYKYLVRNINTNIWWGPSIPIFGEEHQYQYMVRSINTNIWWGPSIPIFGKAHQYKYLVRNINTNIWWDRKSVV